METIKIIRYQSPVGEMLVGSYGDKLCICDWAVEKRRSTIDRRIRRYLNAKYEEGTSDVIERAIGELEEYFAGHRKTFDIPRCLYRLGISMYRMGRADENTLWNDPVLWRTCPPHP